MKHITENVQNNNWKILTERKKAVTRCLKRLGIPVTILGFGYLRQAILLVMNGTSYKNYIVKGLYGNIAKDVGSTISRVERDIRHAIDIGWQRGNAEDYNEIFECTISNLREKPTNSEFIITIADYIQLNEPGEWNK